jgi:hypothetical protein
MRTLFKLFFSDLGQKIWLAALLVFPIILWILPGDFFDGDGLILCPSRLFFGIECYGCGITRSVMHMHHLQFDDAVYYNILGLIVYPALIALWFYWLYKAYKRVSKERAATAAT